MPLSTYLGSGEVIVLPEAIVAGCKPVAAAYRAYRAQVEKWEQAEAACVELRARSRDVDTEAAQAALDAARSGKPIPAARLDGIAQSIEAAERAVDAHLRLAQEAEQALLDAIDENANAIEAAAEPTPTPSPAASSTASVTYSLRSGTPTSPRSTPWERASWAGRGWKPTGRRASDTTGRTAPSTTSSVECCGSSNDPTPWSTRRCRASLRCNARATPPTTPKRSPVTGPCLYRRGRPPSGCPRHDPAPPSPSAGVRSAPGDAGT